MYSILTDIPFGSHLTIVCKDGVHTQAATTTATTAQTTLHNTSGADQQQAVRPADFGRRHVVLTMIVKNETDNIGRCLRAARPLIDAYAISDTGSTDGTQAMIAWVAAELQLPGLVNSVPFKDFGYNRTASFQLARQVAEQHAWDMNNTYTLFVDADAEVQLDSLEAVHAELDARHSSYEVLHYEADGTSWWRTGMVRLAEDWSCKGAAHEYWAAPVGVGPAHQLRGFRLLEHPTGGCKGDKFERELKLLLQERAEHPTDSRTMFYLGRTYLSMGRQAEGVAVLKRALQLSNWDEEQFEIQLLLLQEALKEEPADAAGMDQDIRGLAWRAWSCCPIRPESLAQLARWLRIRSRYVEACTVVQAALQSCMPPPQHTAEWAAAVQQTFQLPSEWLDDLPGRQARLFINHSAALVQLWEELSICGFYSGSLWQMRGKAAVQWLLKHAPDENLSLARKNAQFYDISPVPAPPIPPAAKLCLADCAAEEEPGEDLPRRTWGDVFAFLKSAHFHAEEGRTTPHAESLWDHLVRCGEQSHAKAIALGYTAHEAKKAYFAGFLHDLGKPACLTRSKTHLAYKGHGLVGGAILENAWTPQLGAALQFSPQDWADISMLADVHMCGYFPHQTARNHAVGFQILPAAVKRLLPCLRWGDMAAMESTNPTLFPSDPAPDEARFMTTLLETLDIQRVAKEHPRGILIQLCGASGTGKTTLAAWLKDQFTQRKCIAHIITRDFYTVQETMRRLHTPWDGQITPAIYREAYAYYASTNKAYAAEINSAMKRDIQSALQQGHIVILDTLMTMYPNPTKSILPDCVAQAFRVHLWVHRNTVFTEEETTGRLGMTLAEQLEIHGETGDHWNPFLKRLYWSGLVSATE